MDNMFNAEGLYQELLMKLKAQYAKRAFQLLGLASGGVWVAERLAKDLKLDTYGVINISFYRDDYADKGSKLFNSVQGMATKLPYDVNNAYIIMVDDVLDTGRTVRAALNELFDYGRPAKVDMAVLVDRHRRELPIDAEFKGGEINLPSDHIWTLKQDEQGFFWFSEEKILSEEKVK